jgi:high-affinity K+ transport system ATPase subunit B
VSLLVAVTANSIHVLHSLIMTDATWKQTIAYDEVVFARTTPEQKLKIVKAFQSAGHCCGATGDGALFIRGVTRVDACRQELTTPPP